MVITYPIRTIVIPTVSIRSENVDIEMQVRDRHANGRSALKLLEHEFAGRKKVALFTGPYLKSLLLSTLENQA